MDELVLSLLLSLGLTEIIECAFALPGYAWAGLVLLSLGLLWAGLRKEAAHG